MRGLSVVLEAGERVVNNNNNNSNSPQVISKFSVMKAQPQPQPEPQPQPPPSYYYYNSNFPFSTAFLEHCFLCKKKLLPDFDIYMYDGDKAFCSMECRYTQIYMDERDKKVPREESTLTAIMPHFYISSSPPTPPSSAAAGAGPSSSSSSSNRRGAGNGANGFGY